jgi:hypothetical protein
LRASRLPFESLEAAKEIALIDPQTITAMLGRFSEQMEHIDPQAVLTLKGHLLIEEKLNAILELYLFNANRLEAAGLRFTQKVDLCRGFALEKDELSIWNLILSINKLRNTLAHSLDPERHSSAMQSFNQAYERELASDVEPEARAFLGGLDDAERIKAACSMCLGFLIAFEEDSKGYRAAVDAMTSGIPSGA